MEPATIYYFTGTGNSLVVARALAARIGASLVPVTSTLAESRVETDAEVVGFVFPIYDFRAPRLMDELVVKISALESKYLFAVCTYGLAAGRSMARFAQMVESHGGRLSGGFGIAMPHNGVGCEYVGRSKRAHMLEAWTSKAETIADYIVGRREGTMESSRVLPAILRPWLVRMIPVVARLAFGLIVRGAESLALTASEDCSGCGICGELCPVGNIEMHSGRPQWGDRCIGCFACLHWCPERAISLGGQAMGIEPYHHPDVTLSDMIDRVG